MTDSGWYDSDIYGPASVYFDSDDNTVQIDGQWLPYETFTAAVDRERNINALSERAADRSKSTDQRFSAASGAFLERVRLDR